MFFLKRPVVRYVTEPVKECPDDNPFPDFLCKNFEEQIGNGVVSEVEVFQMHRTLGVPYGIEHVIEFLLSRHQQHDRVVPGEFHAFVTQLAYYQGVGSLCITYQAMQAKQQ